MIKLGKRKEKNIIKRIMWKKKNPPLFKLGDIVRINDNKTTGVEKYTISNVYIIDKKYSEKIYELDGIHYKYVEKTTHSWYVDVLDKNGSPCTRHPETTFKLIGDKNGKKNDKTDTKSKKG